MKTVPEALPNLGASHSLKAMQLTLPEPLELSLTQDDARLGLALGLYVSGRLGLGRAAEVAGLPRPAFQRLMAQQRVPMDYSLQDLHEDVAALKARQK